MKPFSLKTWGGGGGEGGTKVTLEGGGCGRATEKKPGRQKALTY